MKQQLSYLFIVIFSCMFLILQGQEIQTLNDLYFDRGNINTSYIIEDDSKMNISLTSSLGGGDQNTRRINMLAYGNYNKLEIGVGLKVNTAFYGLLNVTTAETLYAKDFSIDEMNRFYIGLNFGVHYVGINTKLLNEYVQLEDPLLAGREFPQYRFTAGFGVGYEFKDRLQAGISIPSLVKNKNDYRADYIINLLFKTRIHPDIELNPELLFYGTQSPNFTGEANVSFIYYDIASLKLGARTTKSVFFGLGWVREVLKVGYIYQLNTGKYDIVNPGVHNVNVSYKF